jgi:Flp pilus assembly protein TadB
VILLALFALALGGVAIAALVWALVLPRTRVSTRLEELSAYGYAAPVHGPVQEQEASSPGLLGGLARRLGDFVASRMGNFSEADLRRLLVAAGMYRTSPRTLLGYRVIFGAGLGAFGLLLGNTLALRAGLAIFFALCGWTLSMTFVRRRAALRAAAVNLEIPNLIDQIVVTLEAGVGFSSSLQIAASRLSGPLGEEMRVLLQEQRMGVALADSLGHLRDRVDAPNVKSFVRAVVQGERLGVSIGQIMRDLALDMRRTRRQAAEERAQKAPVKMLIPLIFLILPTLFIVLLAPAILGLGDKIGI